MTESKTLTLRQLVLDVLAPGDIWFGTKFIIEQCVTKNAIASAVRVQLDELETDGVVESCKVFRGGNKVMWRWNVTAIETVHVDE